MLARKYFGMNRAPNNKPAPHKRRLTGTLEKAVTKNLILLFILCTGCTNLSKEERLYVGHWQWLIRIWREWLSSPQKKQNLFLSDRI